MNTPFASVLTPPRWALGVFALFLALVSCFAQETPPPSPAKLRFIFLDETPGEYTISIGKAKPVPLVANAFAISAPVGIPAGEKIKIFRRTPKAKPIQVAKLSTRADLTSALVVLSPKTDQAPPQNGDKTPVTFYEDTWIDDAATSFKSGQLRVINLTTTPARVTVAAPTQIIEPAGTLVLTPAWDDRGRVRTLVETQQSADWTAIYDSITSHRTGDRITALIIHSEKGLSFSYTDHELKTEGTPPAGDFWLTYTDSE